MDFISIDDILEIHKRVLGHVDPIEGGEFRRTQVYVGGHIPPGDFNLSTSMKLLRFGEHDINSLFRYYLFKVQMIYRY